MDDLSIGQLNALNKNEIKSSAIEDFKVGGYVNYYYLTREKPILGIVHSVSSEKIQILFWIRIDGVLDFKLKWVYPSELSHRTLTKEEEEAKNILFEMKAEVLKNMNIAFETN